MAKLVPASERTDSIAFMMSEIHKALGYSTRWIDGLTDEQVEGIYYTRVKKFERNAKSPNKKFGGNAVSSVNSDSVTTLQLSVYEAILRDEIEVRRRAGLL